MKNKTSGIYKIECIINDKKYIYIGKSIDIDKRWNDHKNELKSNKHHNIFMQRLYSKYGEDNLEFSILKQCKEEELNENEIYFINEYGKNKEYITMNMTDGGDGGNTYKYLSDEKLEEIKRNNSNRMRGNHHISGEAKERLRILQSHPKSEEAKENMRKSWTDERKKALSEKVSGKNNPMYGSGRYGEKNPMYGKVGELSPRHGMKHTQESKNKMSMSRIGKQCGEDNPNYGKHVSEENKKNLSDINSKKILRLDAYYNIICSYKNNTECTNISGKNRYYNFRKNSKINNIKDVKIAKDGFIYIYEEDYLRIIKRG